MWVKNNNSFEFIEPEYQMCLAVVCIVKKYRGKDLTSQELYLGIPSDNNGEDVQILIDKLPVDREYEIVREHLEEATKVFVRHCDNLVSEMQNRRKMVVNFDLSTIEYQ